jgi:dihydroorotate dehydrogenase electron transfer subunit
MIQLKALIIENVGIAPGYYRMRLLAPEIAAAAQPGQFLQLRVAEPTCTDPLLPRPISIYRIKRSAGELELIYKTVGRGTRILAAQPTGALLDIMGPLGRGFTPPEAAAIIALVGGGVGMPPLFCLAETLRIKQPELAISLFYGARSRVDLLELDCWRELGVTVFAATEDGSWGSRGLVTSILAEQTKQVHYDYLAACGPEPMLKAVQQLALDRQLTGELSLEARMACGIGACLGCTCQTTKGYRRVCVDGPVFNLSEVQFDA